MREFKSKSGFLSAVMLLYLIPSFTLRTVVGLVLVVSSLHRDVRSGELDTFLSLPYTRSDLYITALISTFIFTLFPVLLSSAVFLKGDVVRISIFVLGYFGVVSILLSLGVESVLIPFLILFLDFLLGGWKGVNFYSMISPVHQRSSIWAFVFSVFLCVLGWFLFSKRRGVA